MQLAVGFHISYRFAGEDDQSVDRVIVHRVDVAGGRIDVEAALKLDFRVEAADDSFGIGNGRGAGVGLAVVDKDVEKVFVG